MTNHPPLTLTTQSLLSGLGTLTPATVTVVAHAYRVDWGVGVRPRFHHVTKNKACRCMLGPACPSVLRVREYLDAGGERAPDLPDDVWLAVPDHCPICASACQPHPALDFAAHGVGWACTAAGTQHYWEARLRPILRARQALNGQPSWVIPPALGPDGVVLYPGVTVEDVRLIREQACETHRRWRAEGYYPSD